MVKSVQNSKMAKWLTPVHNSIVKPHPSPHDAFHLYLFSQNKNENISSCLATQYIPHTYYEHTFSWFNAAIHFRLIIIKVLQVQNNEMKVLKVRLTPPRTAYPDRVSATSSTEKKSYVIQKSFSLKAVDYLRLRYSN